MTRKDKPDIKRFLDWAQLKVKSNERQVLADLRRGFSTSSHRAWPHLAQFCDLSDDRQRIIWQTVAAGFATHETTGKNGNLGSTLRDLALKDNTGFPEKALKSFEARLRQLLACNAATEVCQRLPGIIRAAKNKTDAAIDYEQLFNDLWCWDADMGKKIKLSWAKAYWSKS